jgi:O-antigen ligase
VVPRGRLGRGFEALLALTIGLALLSAAWSADATLTTGRAVTFAGVLVAGAALASAAVRKPRLVELVVLGFVAGVVILALLGLLTLWDDPDRAITPATTQSPARYNGIGGNPNTMAMLIALALPAVAWCVLAARSRGQRAAALLVAALLYGSLVASGSRGGLLGALAGTIVFAFASRLGRRNVLALVGATLALFVAAVGGLALQQPAETNPVIRYDIVPPPTPPLSPADVQPKLPLESEVGFPRPGEKSFRRTLFTSSGRFDAWEGAIAQALERPLLGYGFGTEERVFVDRYYLHYSDRPENAYLGTLLQLGFAGLAALLALLGAILLRIRLVAAGPAAACAGAFVCGLVLAVGQSYLTSAGSPAMLPFWLCGLLLVGATAKAATAVEERERDEREVDAAQGHRKAGLDVVDTERHGVDDDEDDHAGGRAATAGGQHRSREGERE